MLLDFIYAVFLLIIFILLLCLITKTSYFPFRNIGGNVRNQETIMPAYPSSWPPCPGDKGEYASIGERYTIECIEHFFDQKFTKCRPSFLKNNLTGRNLELDGFCSDIGIAIEYNGIQHYVWPNYTNCSFEDFKKQVERDSLKREKCDQNGICLIIVPYNVPLERIPDYIYSKLMEASTNKNVL